MWHVFIEAGGLVFWSLIVLAVLTELYFVSREEVAWAFGLLGVFAFVMTAFSSLPVLTFFTSGWKSVPAWIGYYVLIGIAWAVTRCILYALKRKRFFYDHKDWWYDASKVAMGLEKNDMGTWSLVARKAFLQSFIDRWNQSEFCRKYGHQVYQIGPQRRDWDGVDTDEATVAKVSKQVFDAVVPKFGQHKAKISMWLSFWPFSIACYFLEDLVVDVVKAVVRWVTKLMVGVNAMIFSRMKKDLGA